MKILNTFLAFCFLFCGAAFASEVSERQRVLDGFIAWDKNLKTAVISFEQNTTFEEMPISFSTGRIYKKNNMIRLDILDQKGKVVQSAVTDKKIINIIDEKGKPVTSLSWKEWQDSQANKALFDFGNYAALLKTHKIKEFAKTEDGYKIIFVPAEGEIYDLEFILSLEDFFPKQISITSEGVRTTTALTDIQKNITLKDTIFK